MQFSGLQWILLGLMVICVVGSILSVAGWIRRSRTRLAIAS
jgi:hypothetical protein